LTVKRRAKKVLAVARTHARVADIRTPFHGVSDRLTREFAAVGHEGLNLDGLSRRGHHQGRAWADLGIAELFRQLAYKGAWRGVPIVVADRFYPSSQLCNRCGWRNHALTLKERTFACASCGLVLDRDLNAALNLRPVAAMPAETQNARGGIVSPGSA
jgi:putative transposase